MSWITIVGLIFTLIEDIPEIEAAIKAIIGVLEGHPLRIAAAFEHIVVAYRDTGDKDAAKAAVLDFHAQHVAAAVGG